MKTGSFLVRLLAGVPVVAGLCLMQGCATTSSKTTETPPAFSNVPPETVATPTPVVSTNKAVEAAPVVEKAVLKPVPPMTTPYTVKAGETATEIAAKYGKRWQDVLAVNPELKKDTKLRTGQTIQLPNPVDLAHPKAVAHKAKKVEKKPAAPTEAKPEAAAPAAAAADGASYTVKKGDTIATIASAQHVKRSDLMKANKLTAKSKLKVGEKLAIPAKAEAAAPAEAAPAAVAPAAAPAPDAGAIPPPPVEAAPAAGAAPAATPAPAVGAAAPAAAAPAAATKTYTVKEGEDVYAVAIRWGVSPAELKALNNLTTSDLQPGQVLKIPAVAAPAP